MLIVNPTHVRNNHLGEGITINAAPIRTKTRKTTFAITYIWMQTVTQGEKIVHVF